MKRNSGTVSRQFIGANTAPRRAQANCISNRSEELCASTATRSPRPMPYRQRRPSGQTANPLIELDVSEAPAGREILHGDTIATR